MNSFAMPIELSFEPAILSKTDFQQMDFRVLGHAYAIQNAYGNQLDERTYQDELAHRLAKEGEVVRSEAGLVLSHGAFRRRYECDLLVNDSIIIECKTLPEIVQTHKRQLLHYMFLTGLPFGRIVNFRPASVQKWMMSNNVSLPERQNPEYVFDSWQQPSACPDFSDIVKGLVSDWGTGLFRGCYVGGVTAKLRDAVQERSLHLVDGRRRIGKKTFNCLGQNSALVVSVYSGDLFPKKLNLQRLLHLTPLEELHWVNLDLHQVTFTRIFR
jgi:GxxExxY protein